jgi:hypothetical protein
LNIFRVLKPIFLKLKLFFGNLLESKNDDLRGQGAGGDRKNRRNIMIVLSLFFLGFLLVTLTKSDVFISPERIVEHETTPGAKLNRELVGDLNIADIESIERESAFIGSQTDCMGIINNLKMRGVLTFQEKESLLRDCRHIFSQEELEAITAISDKGYTGDIATKLLNNLTPDNARKVVEALENSDVDRSLRSGSGDILADNIGKLQNLNTKDIGDLARILNETPPQFRDEVMAAARNIDALSSDQARANLLEELAKAKSPEDVALISDLSKALQSASDDEKNRTPS